MKRFLLYSSVILVLSIGCVFTQPFVGSNPTSTPAQRTTETATQTLSPTAIPTSTSSPTASVTRVIATAPVIILTPTPLMEDTTSAEHITVEAPEYVLQTGSPKWLPNIFHPELDCNFLGVSGQVFGPSGIPVKLIVVESGGILENGEIVGLSLTGNVQEFGPGGYEIIFSDHVIDSSNSVWVQLKDLAGQPLSDKIYFDTFADCQKNLTLINFVEAGLTGLSSEIYLPEIYVGSNPPVSTPSQSNP